MSEEIEQPVTRDQQADHQGGAPVAPQQPVSAADGHRPGHGHQQAVRPGVVLEHQRERRTLRGEREPLDAREYEERPEQVEKLRREEQRPERHRGSRALGSAGDGEMADEHAAGVSGCAGPTACAGTATARARRRPAWRRR